mmetsp:Transcript_27990/g.52777  ORF Transcript_27990/g.52777 Transcript_27990/m.52777 type:complete len:646 (-) Transcript_27990:20-1957(-)
MTENKSRGIEIFDLNAAISPTSIAVTHQIDKSNIRVNNNSEEDTNTYNDTANADQQEDNSSFQLSRIEPTGVVGDNTNMEESLPFDDDDGIASAVPMRHVASYPPHSDHADDVSSLQHTNMEGKMGSHHHPQDQQQQQRPEGVISEEEGQTQYYDEDHSDYYEEEEQARALQRRNMLIVIMLVLFLGLVAAIAAGVGLAVKDNPGSGGVDEAKNEESAPDAGDIAAGITDDEYGGLGGGIDIDDAFLTSVPSSYPSKEGPCIPVEIGIIFDEYSGETGWKLVKGEYNAESPEENTVVWKSKYYKPSEYSKRADTFRKCFSQGEYTFVFTDKEGDGICCNHGEGLYVLSSEGKTISVGGEMQSEVETIPFELPFIEPDPVDEDKDGLDDRLGLMMPYDSSNMTEGVDCENFRLVILTDEYGLETTWELFEGNDKSGTLIANGGPYGSQYNHVISYCLASPNEYSLYMYDWDRRGLCCDSGEGWYSVSSGDIIIRDKNGQFGEVNVTRFVLPADGSAVFTDGPATLSPTSPPASLAPTVTPLLWTTLVPVVEKKTMYPTESLVTPPPSGSPTGSSVRQTASPTRTPTKGDQLDVSATDEEMTSFPNVTSNGLDEETIDKVTSAMDAAEENKGKEDGKDKDKDKEPER